MNRHLATDEYEHMDRSDPSPARPLGRRLVGELLVMGAVFAIYRQIRFLTRNDTDAAMDNAQRVVDFERQFHFFSERSVQDIVMHSHTLVAFLNRYYVTVHFPLTVAFLLWVFFRHHDAYHRIRNTFVSVTVAALAIHVAFPLAPPRMLPEAGFVDTLQRFGPRIYSTDTSESIANQFAAMPSLHFGWAFIVAGAYVSIRRTRRSLWMMLHPAITLLAIVATANHYWLDAAVAGVLVVAAAALLSARRERRLEVAALPTIAVSRPIWAPAIPASWSSSLASNDPPRATASSEDWFAELDAARIGTGLIATDRIATDRIGAGGLETGRMEPGQFETARRESVGELMLLDRCT
jgi:hypothetical protein